MGFWWFMFIFNLMYPLTFIIGGRLLWKHCSKSMSSISGYRSRRSMLNEDTWRFANEDCGKRWWKTGWILLIPTILVQIPFYGKDKDTVGYAGLVICIVEITLLLVTIPLTEAALKRTFNEDGTRKSSPASDSFEQMNDEGKDEKGKPE